MPLADRLSPALTTVRVQHYKGGLESAELIVELMRGAHAEPQHVVLPVEIVIRGSTGATSRGARAKPSTHVGAQAYGTNRRTPWKSDLSVSARWAR